MTPIIIVISADIEWKALCELYPNVVKETQPFGETFEVTLKTPEFAEPIDIRFLQGGWGKISAAASAQYIIDWYHPGLLLNLGTCGGVEGRIKRGTVLAVEKTIVYDLYEQMGDNDEHLAHYTTYIDLSWTNDIQFPSGYQRGFIVSGDRDLVAGELKWLEEKFGAYAGDWESGAIAWVAKKNDVRTVILRGVSDLVGEEGGEAYGNISFFEKNTQVIIRKMVMDLPEWLGHALIKLEDQ